MCPNLDGYGVMAVF